ncbi:MAG: DNA polymerase [Proteobacteria bacterium]|nr:DNA polymerase [Pseudomonadota bacterium]
MKKSRRSYKNGTNQIGKGKGSPTFELVRPPEENFFQLEVFQSKSFKQSNAAREITYRARMKNSAEDVPLNYLLPQLHVLFNTVIQETKRDYGEAGLMRIYIEHPKLESAIIVPPTYLGEMTPELILNKIDNVLYSTGEIPADNDLVINAAVVEFVEGSGMKHILDIDEDLSKKRSVIKIKNFDKTCLSRAIVVGHSHLLHTLNKKNKNILDFYNKVRDHRCQLQRIEAKKLRDSAGIPDDRPGNIDDIHKYEEVLGISITVISGELGNKPIYSGSLKYKNRIFIYHVNKDGQKHFHVITKPNALVCKAYYCKACKKAFNNRTGHKCKDWCNVCGRGKCEMKKDSRICPDCNKLVRSQDCYNAHKKKRKGTGKNKNKTLDSLCQENWQCPECGMNLNHSSKDNHECGQVKCYVCSTTHMDHEQHLCYLRSNSSDEEPEKFIFYDFECTQEDGKHVPNFVVAQSICPNCEEESVTEKATCNNCGSRCDLCKQFNKTENEYERYPCKGCGKRQVIFSGVNTQQEFYKWLISEQHKNFTVIAHNARGYDAYFLYNQMLSNSNVPDPIIFSGTKIMYMKVGKGLNIRILDSLNFLPMPLAKLPKSFGLTEMKKGFFPHFYNVQQNQTVVLPTLPDMKYYDPDSMSKGRREEFFQWYEQHKNEPFDFQKEMKEYCVSDVDILLQACWKFRELLRKQTGVEKEVEDLENLMTKSVLSNAVDPFSYITIASVCMGIFRSKFLSEKWSVLTEDKAQENCSHDSECKCEWREARRMNYSSPCEIFSEGKWKPIQNIVKEKFVSSPIGLVPVHGYAGKDNHSVESMEWLYLLEKEWESEGRNIDIQHARSKEGEKVIKCQGRKGIVQYKVDGYFEWEEKKYVCEFNGCSFHGCETCFPYNREIIMNNHRSMAQRYRDTKLKQERLEKDGYIVLTKWSCEFAQDKKNPDVKKFLDILNIQKPINIRDSFFGGRTNALVLYKKFTEEEKGYYVDFTSLYPDILKYRKFPVGHPERITENFQTCTIEACNGDCFYSPCYGEHVILPYFGIIKASILPPTDLIHPVLPIKCNGKLKFPLCYKCASTDQKEKCTCSDNQRMFTHTYCSPELEVAINMGYEVVQIHEVLHWSETEMYDSQKKEGGLFTRYINSFLKLKQQASGYPDHICTEEEKDEYIQQYFSHEGILLDKKSVEKNPGMRSLSKLALNSFYGKFGQRNNMKQSQYFNDLGKLMEVLTDPSKRILDFHLINDDVICLEYKNSEDFEPQSINTNVTIASFCTSWARLKLWSVMNKLGKRVLYHDTDSIIFSAKEGEYVPPLGEYLGQLTNELTCKELGCSQKNCSGHFIEEFVSCGPKNYAFKVNSGEIVCKVRGFSLNYKSSLVLNFQSMKEALMLWHKGDEKKELITVKTELMRDKNKGVVYNREVCKHYGVVYDKRRVLPDFTTLPFGFKS